MICVHTQIRFGDTNVKVHLNKQWSIGMRFLSTAKCRCNRRRHMQKTATSYNLQFWSHTGHLQCLLACQCYRKLRWKETNCFFRNQDKLSFNECKPTSVNLSKTTNTYGFAKPPLSLLNISDNFTFFDWIRQFVQCSNFLLGCRLGTACPSEFWWHGWAFQSSMTW